jgi:hypothetical protein
MPVDQTVTIGVKSLVVPPPPDWGKLLLFLGLVGFAYFTLKR